jgi:TRAP transporter TAXI family solute receptor
MKTPRTLFQESIRFPGRAVFFLLGLVLITGLQPNPVFGLDLLLGTGETGTFSYFAGRTICRTIDRNAEGLNCTAVPGAGDVHNLTNLQGGSLDLALVDAQRLYNARRKAGEFQFLDIGYEALRLLAPVYDRAVTLVVRKDASVSSLDGLRGKRINIGRPRSPVRFAVNTLLETKSWTLDDFSLVQELSASQSQDTMAFCHGTIQAMLQIGVHPDSRLQQLFELCEADIVDMADEDIRKMVRLHPAFTMVEIPAGTYPQHGKSFTTFATTVVLAVSADLDEETVAAISEAMYSQRRRLASTHPALSTFSLEPDRQPKIGIESHPGVDAYRKRIGIQ